MHLVTWKYDVMEGKNRDDLLAVIGSVVPLSAGAPGLIAKYSAVSPDVKSVTEFYVWTSKAAADRYFDPDWDGETSRAWESARMTREDFDIVNVVERQHVAGDA